MRSDSEGARTTRSGTGSATAGAAAFWAKIKRGARFLSGWMARLLPPVHRYSIGGLTGLDLQPSTCNKFLLFAFMRVLHDQRAIASACLASAASFASTADQRGTSNNNMQHLIMEAGRPLASFSSRVKSQEP